ncbi:hypothetical protein [Brevundimonas sp. Root1279]|uniref:hypothetical protein n=1 Tax=Brevundimonas sp. Root1279 TaxID=1736443 RepID=UPI0006F698B3|nr:hypothetical protein [Brevundimonas sp. Root1279]KQW79714.1 hypothetical protein ASC65_14290 [Brevundimonas sp. Root1279]
MAISDGIGTTIAIGPSTASDDASTITALTPYVDIAKVETIPEFGPSAATITFTGLDGKVIKRKGARDAGDIVVTFANVPGDAGQEAMIAAEASKLKYAFKITAADEPDEDGTPSTFYLIGLVNTNKVNVGQSNAVNKRSFSILLDDVHEVPAEPGP